MRGDPAPTNPAGKSSFNPAVSLRVQSLIAVALALILLLVSPVAAYSSLFGSLSVYLPGLFFTVLVARKIGSDSGEFLRTAALAELGKLALMALLCGTVFLAVKPLAAEFFFVGMFVSLAASWVGLAMAFRMI